MLARLKLVLIKLAQTVAETFVMVYCIALLPWNAINHVLLTQSAYLVFVIIVQIDAKTAIVQRKQIVLVHVAETAIWIQAKNAMTAIPQTEMVAVQLAKNPKLAMKFVLLL